jgi:AAA15 family ATPase/GTPase
MIEKLTVRNFKSIKELDLDCRRVNLFIGEPNTGKSNILETLGLLSWSSHPTDTLSLGDYVRYRNIQNLFYDDQIDQPVEIIVKLKGEKVLADIKFQNNQFAISYHRSKNQETIRVDHEGRFQDGSFPMDLFSQINYYRFKSFANYNGAISSYLMPPFGANMFSVVMGHKKLKETMASFFKAYGFQVVFKPQEQTFEIQKHVGDIIISFPLALISDTLRRTIFFIIAMESNNGSTLIFEEPEAHTFPYYTKYIGEKVATDDSNQYFIATHNPYFLEAVLEKAKKDDVSVFVTYVRDYQTKVKSLTDEQISEIMSQDPFLSLNKLVEEENR